MDNSKFLKVIIIILLLINLGTLGFIWTSRPHGPMPPPRNGGDVFDFLNHELAFSPEQKNQFKDLREEHRKNIEHLREAGRVLHDSFFDLLQDSVADASSVNQMADSLVANQREIELLTFEHFQKVRNLCNPSQQQAFDQIIKDALRRMAPGPGMPPRH